MAVDVEVPLRIVLVGPPLGVAFALQRGKDELVSRQVADGEELAFELTVRAKGEPGSGPPNFLGPFAQGTPADRFVYVNSGARAGEPASCWDRRAKVRLAGITWEMVEQVRQGQAAVIEARIPGTSRDGGPICAGAAPIAGWKPVPGR
jgi:hypothetical protein